MQKLVVSPFLGNYLVIRPGARNGFAISCAYYRQLDVADADSACPQWLVDSAWQAWGLDLAGQAISGSVKVRAESGLPFGRASYELNLGCNYDCEHCYLGAKQFESLDWGGRARLLEILHDAGVLWLQLTGGEPMADRLFAETYEYANELGMICTILSNGSRLCNPKILELLSMHRPHRITLSVYGATAESYDSLTRRKGAFRRFEKGLYAARAAGLPLALSVIVTRRNAHEVDQMHALAERLGVPMDDYVNIVPTIRGGPETLASQSTEHLRKRRPFTGCNAGHSFFHVDPHGMASICKVARDPQIALLEEGVEGLQRLGAIADRFLPRHGGCAGCTLSETCGTCMPLVQLYRTAQAPLAGYCQRHTQREGHAR